MRISQSGMATVAAGLVLLSATLALISCGDDRSAGLIVTSDGRMLSNSAENTRSLAQGNIDRDLQRYLGEHWRVKSSILQLPEWMDDHGLDADWRWTQCDTTVEVVGDGQAQLPITADDIRDGVRDYLQRRVEHSRHHLTIAVRVVVDAARFAVLAKPVNPEGQAPAVIAAAPAPAQAPTASPETPAVAAASAGSAPAVNAPMQLGAQAYVIQAGDTLAEISAVFYGSTRYWRKILQANPTLDPNSLQVGQQIMLPALHAEAGRPPAAAQKDADKAPPDTTAPAADAAVAPPAKAAQPVQPEVPATTKSASP